jgi:hypothetical protein
MNVDSPKKTSEEAPTEKQMIAVSQLITVAMAMGMMTFAMVAALVAFNGNKPRPNNIGPIPLEYLCGAAPVLGLVAMLTMRQIMQTVLIGQLRTAEKTIWNNSLKQAYQQQLLIGHALCEGAGLFCGIGFLVTHEWWLLGPMALALAGILLRFPTIPGYESWKQQIIETAEA